MTDSALVVPTMTSSGAATVVSKVVPFSGPSSQTGNKGSMYFKYVEVQDEPVTKKQYDQATWKNGWKKKAEIKTKEGSSKNLEKTTLNNHLHSELSRNKGRNVLLNIKGTEYEKIYILCVFYVR